MPICKSCGAGHAEGSVRCARCGALLSRDDRVRPPSWDLLGPRTSRVPSSPEIKPDPKSPKSVVPLPPAKESPKEAAAEVLPAAKVEAPAPEAPPKEASKELVPSDSLPSQPAADTAEWYEAVAAARALPYDLPAKEELTAKPPEAESAPPAPGRSSPSQPPSPAPSPSVVTEEPLTLSGEGPQRLLSGEKTIALDRGPAQDELPPAPVRRTESQVLPPMTVVGAYRLLSVIGEGGMGHVYLAEHTKLSRRVALKMLRTEYAENPNAVRRFFDEARAVNQIRHENIIEVTDFVEGRNGEPSYFIMELLSGTDLAQVEASGPVGLKRALHIGRQVASALIAAHRAGVVHRDLKPENIYLIERRGDRNFVKLLDFGVAKLADPLQQGERRTQAGAILGTPEYMSPEQAGGTAVDSRTDVYAFGVILYEMIAGRRPFEGRSFGDFVVAHLSVMPVPPSQVPSCPQPIPPALEALTLRCLAKPPEERPQAMAEVEEELARIEAQLDFPPPAPASVIPVPKRRASPTLGLALGALVIAGAVGITAVSLAHRGKTETPKRASPPQQVTIHLSSTPPGAEVYREGSDVPLGVTPMEWTTERSSAHARFEFRFPGRDRNWSDIELSNDRDVAVTLAPTEPPAGPVAGPATAVVPLVAPAPTPVPAVPASGKSPVAKAKVAAAKPAPAVRPPPVAKPAPAKAVAPPSPKTQQRLDRDSIADPFSE